MSPSILYGTGTNLTANSLQDAFSQIRQEEAKIYYSKNGNKAYTLTPFSIRRGPLCEKLNTEYRVFVMRPLSKASDMPCLEKGDICPLFEQRTYMVDNWMLDASLLPRFMQSGFYKLVLILRNSTAAITGKVIVKHVLT